MLAAFRDLGFSVLRLDPAEKNFSEQIKSIDIAFLALHGHGGEDGQIQKRLEKLGIPYTGSGPSASRNAFDKVRAKNIFKASGVSTAPFIVVSSRSQIHRLSRIGYPLFVKPVAEGSSVGAFAIREPGQATGTVKIQKALARHGRLLAEPRLAGREFTVAILGRCALPVIELRPTRDFFDFKAKYTPGLTHYDVPARVPPALSRQMQRLALKAHRALRLVDFSRVDLMTDEKGRIYVLEVNSIPGMTSMSLLPKAANVMGISFPRLCEKIVRMALLRHRGVGKRRP